MATPNVKHSGTWKTPNKIFVKHAGAWKEPTGAWVKSGGTWQSFWPTDPTLTLNIYLTSSLDSRITFTRASTGTYSDSAGVLQTAAVDVPRFNHHPTTFVPRGLLLEMVQRTNACLQSNNIGAASWTTAITAPATVTRTANAALAPDGTMSACLIVCTRTATNQNSIAVQYSMVTTAGGGQHTISIWVKAKDAASVGKTITMIHWFTILGGNKLITLTADWVRHEGLTGNVTNRSDNQFRLGLDTVGPANAELGPVEFYAWGAQFENAAPVSSLIPTTTAAATRAADSAVMTGTNFSSWYTQGVGTFVVTFDVATIATGVRVLSVANNGTNAERVQLATSAATAAVATVDNNVIGSNITVSGSVAANTPAKLAMSFALNDIAGCLNGGTVGVDTAATMPTVDRLHLGMEPTGASLLMGHIKEIKFFNVAKSNAEMQALTAP